MLLANPKSLEDFIVEKLTLGDSEAKQLLASHNSAGQTVTLQAVYKALKKLCAEDVLLKHKNMYSLNNVWRNGILDLLQQGATFPRLQPGESIAYSFKSLAQLDAYWKHIQESDIGDVAITYFFCPHQYWWFVPGRRESETHFYAQFAEKKRNAVLLLGGTTAVDKQMRGIISNPYVQVHIEPEKGFRVTDNLTVKNDLIVQTRLPRTVSIQINEIFERNLSMEETGALLGKLFSKKIPVKIRMERNARKAEKLKKQIGKYFYIKHVE
jgi:hypothetical protein